MLKFEHNSDGTVIEATGDMSEVLADVGLMVNILYNHIADENEKDASDFKRAFTIGFLDGSPVWTRRDIKNLQVRTVHGLNELLTDLKRRKEAGSGESHS